MRRNSTPPQSSCGTTEMQEICVSSTPVPSPVLSRLPVTGNDINMLKNKEKSVLQGVRFSVLRDKIHKSFRRPVPRRSSPQVDGRNRSRGSYIYLLRTKTKKIRDRPGFVEQLAVLSTWELTENRTAKTENQGRKLRTVKARRRHACWCSDNRNTQSTPAPRPAAHTRTKLTSLSTVAPPRTN